MRRFVNTFTGLFSIPGSAPLLFFFFQILELMGAFLFSASSVCLTFRLPIQNKNFKLDAYLQYFDPNEGRCVPRDHIGRILASFFLIIFIFLPSFFQLMSEGWWIAVLYEKDYKNVIFRASNDIDVGSAYFEAVRFVSKERRLVPLVGNSIYLQFLSRRLTVYPYLCL